LAATLDEDEGVTVDGDVGSGISGTRAVGSWAGWRLGRQPDACDPAAGVAPSRRWSTGGCRRSSGVPGR